MSVEAYALAALVEEGTGGLRKLYQHGVTAEDFQVYEDEFKWVEERAAERKAINPRIFRRAFPDFEWTPTEERLQDLLDDLKNERAFTATKALVHELSMGLEVDNAIDMAQFARDSLAEITRLHAPASDHALISEWEQHYTEQKAIRALRNAGEPPGIPTGLKWLDHHWDGLGQGRLIVILGRPGEGKSMLIGKFAAHAVYNGYRTVIFSPEMKRREHQCRIHTTLSAYPKIKAACNLRNSFRNRALMSGVGYNLKKYKRFLQHLADNYGEIHLLTMTHRRQRMTAGFIESKVEELQPDLVIVDPIYLLGASRQRVSRWEEILDNVEAMEHISEAFNVPVVITNQAKRPDSGKMREDAPNREESFGSDVPSQMADHVIGVKHISDEHRLIVRCTKSRFGSDFRFECSFFPNVGIMKELSEPSGNYYNGHDEDMDDEELKQMIDEATGRERANA
jgi:hypothetical protein